MSLVIGSHLEENSTPNLSSVEGAVINGGGQQFSLSSLSEFAPNAFQILAADFLQSFPGVEEEEIFVVGSLGGQQDAPPPRGAAGAGRVGGAGVTTLSFVRLQGSQCCSPDNDLSREREMPHYPLKGFLEQKDLQIVHYPPPTPL